MLVMLERVTILSLFTFPVWTTAEERPSVQPRTVWPYPSAVLAGLKTYLFGWLRLQHLVTFVCSVLYTCSYLLTYVLTIVSESCVWTVTLLLCRRILRADVIFPKSFSKATRSFIQQLLTHDPAKRLGSHSAEQIKSHAFFKVSRCFASNSQRFCGICGIYLSPSLLPLHVMLFFVVVWSVQCIVWFVIIWNMVEW